MRPVTMHIVAALIAAYAGGSVADSYPSRSIRLVVAQAPGGQNDVIARMLTPRLTDILKQPVVVENRGGVGGTIGADFVAKAPPDGYTLLVGGSNNLAVAATLHRNLPYDPIKDFAPIGGVAQVPYALAMNAKVPARTLAELVAYARMHPGRLNYGSGGNGSMSGLAAELFKSMAGIDIVQIPYKGSAPAVADLVSGHVDIMFADLSLVLPHAKTGTLHLLAAAGATRTPNAPDLATVAEQGFPGFAVAPWYGLVAPAATPAAIIAKLDQALAQTLRSDEVRQRLLQQGYEPIDARAPALGPLIRSDIVKYATLIKSAGIKAEE